MFWLPIFLIIIFGTIMAIAGKKGLPGISFIVVLIHTLLVRIVFWEHSLLFMILFFTIQLWVMFFATYFQRDRWRKIEKIGNN
ncbi:MAG: hypothetical protein ABWX61_04970 [Paenisporosarcina sp.]